MDTESEKEDMVNDIFDALSIKDKLRFVAYVGWHRKGAMRCANEDTARYIQALIDERSPGANTLFGHGLIAGLKRALAVIEGTNDQA